jgi:hypothetical protein
MFTRHYSENIRFVIDETQHLVGYDEVCSPERVVVAVNL